MVKKFPAFALLVWLLPALLQASNPRDPYQYFFEQTLGDLTEEREIAREQETGRIREAGLSDEKFEGKATTVQQV